MNYPEAMQSASLLFVASAGGFCFKNEAQFFSTAANGQRTAGFQYAILPFYERLFSGNFPIPSREDMLAKTKFAIVGGAHYAPVDYDTKESTLYPNTGKFGIIPLLPANLRKDERDVFDNARIALIEERADPEKLEQYADDVEGDTYCTYTAGTWYYVNNMENVDRKKTASFALKTLPGVRVSLTSEPHMSAMIGERDGKLQIYLNNYRTDVRALNESLKKELDGGDAAEDVIAEWFTLDDLGNPKGVTDTQTRTTELVLRLDADVPDPTVTFTAIEEYARPCVHREIYDADAEELRIEIEHNGAVWLEINLPAADRLVTTEKPLPDNAPPPVFDLPEEYAQKFADLHDPAIYTDDYGLYQEYSVNRYRRLIAEYEARSRDKTLSPTAADELLERIGAAKTALIDVRETLAAIAEYRGGADKQFDIVLRALYSPTLYVEGKENGLEIHPPYRKDVFDTVLRDQKVEELRVSLEELKKAAKPAA